MQLYYNPESLGHQRKHPYLQFIMKREDIIRFSASHPSPPPPHPEKNKV